MKKTILKIEGMSCSACSNGLEKYLNKQPGVEATVNLVMATANIKYDNNVTMKDLERFISEAGFKSLGEEKILEEETKSNLEIYILGVLGLLIMYITMNHMLKLPTFKFLDMEKSPISYSIIVFILTIPFIYYAKDLLVNGFKSAIKLIPNMDTLVSIGIISSYLYSIFGVIMITLGNHDYVHYLYFESTIFVIFFIKLGKYIVDNRKNKTKDAIRELVTITPNKAHIKTEDGYKDITIDEIKEGDILVCLAGERIAVDGEIVKGTSNFDETFITGESLPVLKKESSKVLAGSINYDSVIEYKAERIGKNSSVSEIVRLVVEATNTKPNLAKTVDKICSYFVPAVLVVALLTFLINLIFGGINLALTRFITVLVVACPCSLGLATPLALVVSISSAAKKGILIKDGEYLEQINKIDTVIFDKTGTLTNGILTISQINNHCDLKEHELLELLASIEKYSTHPIAVGITKYCADKKIKGEIELEIQDLPGYGVKARSQRNIYYLCNKKLLKRLDIINSYEHEEQELIDNGNNIIYFIRNNKLLATIGLQDTTRKESKEIVTKLKGMNKNVIMLSGDSYPVAERISKELGIDNIVAEATPQEKTEYIKKLLEEGHYVMMVGDGINDAPSLTSATLGVSISSGTDIATNAANIVLVNNNLLKIEELFNICKKTIKNIKGNLFWAGIYNIIMIPLAAGIIPFIRINPMIACLAMIISSISVTLNALRLKR